MFEVVVTARVQNRAMLTGWQVVGALVIHTSTNRLNAERLVEQPALLYADYKRARNLLLDMYPHAAVGMEVRQVV